MQNYKDNQMVSDENTLMKVSVLSMIGDREEQQDNFGYSLKNGEGLVVICDGMGGRAGGQVASNCAVTEFVSDYEKNYPFENVADRLIFTAKRIDEKIAGLKDEEGGSLHAGSTCVAVLIRDRKLYWCSVGDSRAYLLREDDFIQFTQDQNYYAVLDGKKQAGLLSDQEYEEEQKRGEALISFLGIGKLSLIDYGNKPLSLKSGDRIILMTDGLYKLVPDLEIQRVIDNFRNNEDALNALNIKAKKHAKESKIARDNMTVAIIQIK